MKSPNAPRRNAIVLGLVMLTSIVLAGCLDDGLGESGIRAQDDLAIPFQEYNFNQPWVTDGQSNLLTDHEFLRDLTKAPLLRQPLLIKAGPEPNVGITKAGNVFVSTLDHTQASFDKGLNWQVVWEYTFANNPNSHDVIQTLDPMLWVDPDTNRIFVGHLEIFQADTLALPWCVFLTYSDDEGKTWTDKKAPLQYPIAPVHDTGHQACGTGVIDHQKIMTSKPGKKTDMSRVPPVKLNQYPNVLYLCYNKYDFSGGFLNTYAWSNPITGTWCETSWDSGRTWTESKQINPQDGTGPPGCYGINGHPAADRDGTVYVPLGGFLEPFCKRGPTVMVSEDSGQTWVKRSFGNATIGQREIDPEITCTDNGVCYNLFRSKSQHMYLLRSRDKFQTWEGPWRVSPPDHTLNVFAGLTAGSDGRLAMAYLGTRDAQEKEAEPSNATGGTFWQAYITYTLNAEAENPTFYTVQVTPEEDPVQVGCIWLKGGGGGPRRCRNLLDFVDLGRDTDGRLYFAFTDGCVPRNGCTTDTDSMNYQSHDRQATLIVQDSGLSLFADKGILPPIGIPIPQPFPR